MTVTKRTVDDKMNLVIKYFTKKGKFTLSSGETTDTYIDLRAAILTVPSLIDEYLSSKISDLGVEYCEPVGTGASGALLLGLLRRNGYLWNPKEHGVEWSPEPIKGSKVFLVDDIYTTGRTLKRLREACEKAELDVIGEIVLYKRDLI